MPYPLHEGDVIQYRLTNPDNQVFEFENYYLAPGTYEAAARRAGFNDFHWVDAMLEPTERADPYWDDFLDARAAHRFQRVEAVTCRARLPGFLTDHPTCNVRRSSCASRSSALWQSRSVTIA